MENFWHIAFTWIHILGVALYVGPQLFLAIGVIPATRAIADMPTRVQAMRTVTRRFGYVGGAGLVLLIAAGSYLIADWRDHYGVPDDVEFTSLRFGVVFIIKMTLLLVMLALVGLHTFLVGPRLIDAMEAEATGRGATDDELRSLRMQSMALSITGLVLALAIMVMGVMLGTPEWSLQDA
jgi:uncharacterized membrane protein